MLLECNFLEDPKAREALRKFPERFAAEVTAAMGEIAARLTTEVQKRTPKGAFGAAGLLGNIHPILPYHDGTAWNAGAGASLPYAEPVELGTRPHFPPVQALEDWVREKISRDAKEIPGIAFCVARKISLEGTEGHFMFRDALQENEAWIRQRLSLAVERTLEGEA
jgi:hypothetical protein